MARVYVIVYKFQIGVKSIYNFIYLIIGFIKTVIKNYLAKRDLKYKYNIINYYYLGADFHENSLFCTPNMTLDNTI